MDAISEERLAQVIPPLGALIRKMVGNLMVAGIEVRVTQGLRSIADQDALYAQGRTVSGNIVTNAPGGYSMHNFGLAVDLCPGIIGKTPWTPDWTAQDTSYKAMVTAGVALGLNAGANWHTFVDIPHFQLPGLPNTPTELMRHDLSLGGLSMIWRNVLAGIYNIT
jgi:peptidoglycan L-alanyl-D-glutamate endopeptidase CwlK